MITAITIFIALAIALAACVYAWERYRHSSPAATPPKHVRGTVGQLQQQQGYQSGSATLVAGTVTVTDVDLGAQDQILISRSTPGGTVGNLSCPNASRVTSSAAPQTGQFVINSDSAHETSRVDWFIVPRTRP